MKETEDIRNFFFQKKDDEHFPRHDIICKSRKDAKDKAQKYGLGNHQKAPIMMNSVLIFMQ